MEVDQLIKGAEEIVSLVADDEDQSTITGETSNQNDKGVCNIP